MQLSQQQIRNILDNAPAGSDQTQILDGLVKRGYQLEGVDMEQATARVTPQEPASSSSNDLLDKAADGFNSVFGGGKLGEAIGTTYAKHISDGGRQLKEQLKQGNISQEQYDQSFELPTGKQIIGDTLRVGANFVPIGKGASIASKGLGALGISKGSKTAGNIISGAATGAAIDTTTNVANDEDVALGAGTVFGAGIPLSSPIVSALGRAMKRTTAVAGTEISGALTGTSAETLEQAFIASRAGDGQLDQFTNALRGQVTPEALVDTLRNSISQISTSRQALFRSTLEELGDTSVRTDTAKSEFVDRLSEARIGVNPDRSLNFSKSKLKLVPNAQEKLQNAWGELLSLPDNVSLLDLDTTRQAIKGLTLAGDDASANLGNKLIEDAVRSVRSAGEEVVGYRQMLDQFSETSSFLDELSRGLASGERATIDQTYRRMATSLKTNNEQRMALVRELDDATDGAILSGIAGQQLSEAMPRGIFRQISAGIAGGAAVTGGVSASLLPALVLASPRVSGEFVRALGIGASKTQIVVDALDEARSVLLKSGIIGGTVLDPSEEE